MAEAEAKFWESPDFSRVSMPPGFPDALRRTATRFLNEYRSQLRPFEATEYEVAPNGERVSTRFCPGYFAMMRDFARSGRLQGPYGASVITPPSPAHQ